MVARNQLAVLGAASVLSIALFTSCGAQQAPSNVDHAKVMQDARAKLVAEFVQSMKDQGNGESTGSLTGVATLPMGSINIKGDFSAAQATVGEAINGSAKFSLGADANLSGMGTIKADLGAEMRILDKMLYMNLSTVNAESSNPDMMAQINAVLPMAKAYAGKWFKLDAAELAKMQGSSVNALSFNTDTKQAEEILGLLKDYEVFERLEVLPMDNGMYVYKVKPNAAELTKLFKAISMKSNPSATMTEAEEASLTTLFQTLGDSRLTHTLYIDSKDNTYKKFTSKGTMTLGKATADLSVEFASKSAGTASMMITLKATSAEDAKGVTFTLSGNSTKTSGDFSLVLDAPTQQTKVDVKGNATFKAGTPTITAPESAEDLMAMIKNMVPAAPSAMAPTSDAMNAAKGDDALAPATDETAPIEAIE